MTANANIPAADGAKRRETRVLFEASSQRQVRPKVAVDPVGATTAFLRRI
jgi:hypothetical protein